jgi:hypothetical protein
MSDHNDTVPFDDGRSDEELTETAQLFEAMLDEMKAWDTEDAEDAASGKFPLPAQPYSESPRFEVLTQEVEKI